MFKDISQKISDKQLDTYISCALKARNKFIRYHFKYFKTTFKVIGADLSSSVKILNYSKKF